ncbi:MAG TPA: DNA methyltransferase [Ktedonobacterales bacterium]|nr:DNA methyltransferase [Ktedonobacterales bacterium]
MTELIWEGKYDKDGKRVAPVRIALPFQTVETVNESGQQRANQLGLWAQGQPGEWRNRLIWGDKKYVLPALLPEFAGKVNLIYIDPPFATGADFSFTTTIPESDDSFLKEPSMIEQKAYRDTWGRGLDSYLQWFYETVALLRDLLADDGSFYVHLDYHVSHYAKVILDEVFGAENFRSEIAWKRTSSHNDPNKPGNIHDTILFYTASTTWTWNPQYQPLDQEYLDKVYVYSDERGRYRLDNLTAPGVSNGVTGQEWRGVNPTSFGRHWRRPPEELEIVLQQGGIQLKRDGKPSINGWKQYLDKSKGMSIQSIWQDLPNVTGISSEKLRYVTQKPESLLSRIISASSNPREGERQADLVLDCFCGSGTTAAVAEKLGRRWITCDLGRFAIHTTRKRLLSIPNVRPFMVENLGKYERQAWQTAEFAQGDQRQAAEVQLAYRRFMLDLYRARPIEGYLWLHGERDGRLIHVGGVDAPISVGDVRAIIQEFWKASGQAGVNGVDILGWDFAFEVNEVAKQMAAENNVNLKFKRIPREVLEKRAVEQGDIRFFELGALSVRVSQRASETFSAAEQANGPAVTITLTDFIAPYDDVPPDVLAKVTSWAQWIDYWAVDWDYQGDAFHNMAQQYRTRKDPQLQLSLGHTYEQPGTYTVVVKVIDILGNDTTRTLSVTVK